MRRLRLTGQILRDNKLVGYVVVDMGSNTAKMLSTREVVRLIQATDFELENAKFEDGKIKGTEGSLRNLTKFSADGSVMDDSQRITVLGRIRVSKGDNVFLVMDSFGRKKKVLQEGLILLIAENGSTNAKVVNKEGKKYISGILTEIKDIEDTFTPKKKPNLKEEIAKNGNIVSSVFQVLGEPYSGEVPIDTFGGKGSFKDIYSIMMQMKDPNLYSEENMNLYVNALGINKFTAKRSFVPYLLRVFNSYANIYSYLYPEYVDKLNFHKWFYIDAFEINQLTAPLGKLEKEWNIQNKAYNKKMDIINFAEDNMIFTCGDLFESLKGRREKGEYLSSEEFRFFKEYENAMNHPETDEKLLSLMSSKSVESQFRYSKEKEVKLIRKEIKKTLEEKYGKFVADRRFEISSLGIRCITDNISFHLGKLPTPPVIEKYLRRGRKGVVELYLPFIKKFLADEKVPKELQDLNSKFGSGEFTYTEMDLIRGHVARYINKDAKYTFESKEASERFLFTLVLDNSKTFGRGVNEVLTKIISSKKEVYSGLRSTIKYTVRSAEQMSSSYARLNPAILRHYIRTHCYNRGIYKPTLDLLSSHLYYASAIPDVFNYKEGLIRNLMPMRNATILVTGVPTMTVPSDTLRDVLDKLIDPWASVDLTRNGYTNLLEQSLEFDKYRLTIL